MNNLFVRFNHYTKIYGQHNNNLYKNKSLKYNHALFTILFQCDANEET